MIFLSISCCKLKRIVIECHSYLLTHVFRLSFNGTSGTAKSLATLSKSRQDNKTHLAVVRLATSPGILNKSLTAGAAAESGVLTFQGTVIDYVRNDTVNTNYSYLSPFLSHVVLERLAPNQTYYYIVGDGKAHWSSVLKFKTLPHLSATVSPYPIRIGLMSDVGQVNDIYLQE